jgi:ubiquinone/menaquinone biosynthesis C-methylase UbiE
LAKRKNKKIPPRIPEGEAILDNIEFTMEDYSEACKKMGREYQRLIDFILFELGVKKNSKILEIGPGPGWIGIWMAKEDPSLEIIGLELSEDMIRVANKNKIEEGVQEQIKYIYGNAENMKFFENDYFDVVFSNGSLHHWENPIKVFNEIERVLKNEGVYCISDGRRDIDLRAKILFYLIKWFIPKFMRLGWKTSIMAGYIPEELEGMMEQSNLRNNYQLKSDLFDLFVFNRSNFY